MTTNSTDLALILSKPVNEYAIIDYQLGDELSSQEKASLPTEATMATWLACAIAYLDNKQNNTGEAALALKLPVELSIRIVSNSESQSLNKQYRGKDKPTNVLSFESELPDYIPSNLLGDLVICAPVVMQEAQEQAKEVNSHWAHMCIHGCLHLLGFDHIEEKDAVLMESIEVEILHKLGIDDPYQISTR